LGDGHLRPTVIVGISDDEAGKSKEKIDCQIRMAYQTQGSVPTKRIIEEVKDHNQKCRATSQAIQDLKVFLAAACPVGVDSTICFPIATEFIVLVISVIMICCSSFNADSAAILLF
jgi:hypothetical protein